MTILAVFRSRAQTLDCAARLREAGIPVQTVSTPKEAGVGCGVSVKFEENFFPRVRIVLSRRAYSSFSGFLKRRGNSFMRLE